MTRFVLMIAVAATSAAPGLRYAAHPGDGAGLACRGVKAPRSAYLGRVSGGRVQLPIALRATGLPDRAPSGDAWTPEAAVRCSVIVEERDGETWSTVTGGIATGPMEPSGDGWRTPEGEPPVASVGYPAREPTEPDARRRSRARPDVAHPHWHPPPGEAWRLTVRAEVTLRTSAGEERVYTIERSDRIAGICCDAGAEGGES
jgi:hypothetical protein